MSLSTQPMLHEDHHGIWRWLALLGLAAVVLIAHGGSLWDGIFLDDHWQRVASRDYGWTPHDLIESATIDFSGRWNRIWWQDEPLVWRYARPIGMLAVKLEYLLMQGNAVGIHACGLGWHLLTAWLVYRLAMWGGLSLGWAFLAAVLFAIHPHGTFAIAWTSARNAVVNACFLAAALLTYIKATQAPDTPNWPRTLIRWLWPIGFWILALLSRETGIIFPLIILAVDASLGGWMQLRRRVPVYLVVGLICIAFLYWRLVIFEVAAVPIVYFSRPEGLSYLPWAASKLLYLLFALIFHTPMIMGPVTAGRISVEIVVLHAVFVLLLAGIAGWYLWASRGYPTRWVWPLWMVAAFIPVVPVFAAPHFAYLGMIPQAIILAIMCRHVARNWRVGVTTLLVIATLWSLFIYRVCLRGAFRSEQLVFADVVAQTPKPRPDSRVFLINLPMANSYASLTLREALARPNLEACTLTLATHPLMMDQPSTVEVLSDHEIVVSSLAQPYFSGLSGGMFLHVLRGGSPLKQGDVVREEDFDAEVLEADEQGVRKFKFTFREPLASEHYLFYVCSPVRAAYRLRFDKPAAGLEARDADRLPTPADAGYDFHHAATTVALMRADPILSRLNEDRLSDEGRDDAVREWWTRIDGPRLYGEWLDYQQRFATELAEQRRFLFVFDVVSSLIRSDLFLTGGNK